MGRLFEALRHTEAHRRPHDEDRPVLCPVPVEEPVGEKPLPTEEVGAEIPYIEVGPRHSVEASADVLACPAPALRRLPPPQPAPAALPIPPVEFRPPPESARLALTRPSLFAPELTAFHGPDEPAGERYRHLLGSLLPAAGVRPGESCPVLLFTAGEPGVGATTLVLNTAIAAAQQGTWRVIVVDANLRHPAVAGRLGLPPAPGLREVLTGAAPLDGALQPTVQQHLSVLTAGLAAPGPGPRFVAETMRSLLRHLRQRADLVFVDGPCWDGRPEVTTLAAAADAVYVVLPEDQAESPQADALLQSVPASGARLAGCVLAGRVKEEG
jgi:Mrp family chromosome partitioning ATPase